MIESEFFSKALDLDHNGLVHVKAAIAAEDLSAAKAALAAHIRERTAPQWLFDYRDRPQPTRKAEDFPKALAVERHEFAFAFHGAPEFTAQFGDVVDWGANPTQGVYKTHLWNECLNRHFHFDDLSIAYWQTGDERFARAIARDWIDWVEHNPRPEDSGNQVEWPYGSYAWQTLTTAIRLEASWPNALYRCLDAAALTDEVIVTMMRSVCDQARHLMQWPTANNWLTEECMGLFTAGMLFPELNEAAQWRCTAIQRLYGQLTQEVYPDGAEYELATSYGVWVVRNFVNLLERARLNHLEAELPDDLIERLEKMFDYLLSVSMPDGHAPRLNDSSSVDLTEVLQTGYELFPQRRDFQYVASQRAEGEAPVRTSMGLAWSGHYVMRTGWDADSIYMLVDAGPYGSAHQHEDKLHFIVHAYGCSLILDPGNFSYDASPQREYVLTTPGHNTVMVDGMGQRRRGNKETYVRAQPWSGEMPPDSDTLWVTTTRFDVLRGSYGDGYGRRKEGLPKNVRRPENDEYEIEDSVTHTRRIIFLKPDYWVIVDTMSATDGETHVYEALFHLDAEDAVVDAASRAVITSSDEANVVIHPLADAGLDVALIKGQEDPVQGWGNNPWRPVPTAIYRFTGRGTCWAAYAVEPVAKGGKVGVSAIERIESTSDGASLGLEVRLANGTRDVVLVGHQPAGSVAFGEWAMDGEIGVVRLRAAGEVDCAFVVGGEQLSRQNVALPCSAHFG